MQLAITSDLETLEPEWRRFEQRAECTPFQSFDWLAAWQRCIGRGVGVTPAIVTGRQPNGELLFILPLAIERSRFSRWCVFLGHDVCDYNGPLLAPEFSSFVAPSDFAKWWRVVEAFMREKADYRYDVVFLDKMPERIGRQANPLLALSTTPNPNCAYRANLGQDWDSYYGGKRSSATRGRERTKRRRLADNGELRLVIANDPDNRKNTLRTLFDQKSQRLAQKDEAGLPRHGFSNLFAQPGQSNFYLSVADKADSFVHVTRLDIGSTCVAANMGLQFGESYYYVLASFADGPLSRFGPGVFHLHELMRYAISRGFRHFDFTIGDHPYKLDWADETFTLYDYVGAPSWLGLPVAAKLILIPRAKQWLKTSPSLWKLARRGKLAAHYVMSWIRGGNCLC
jgi:CelD/BcsL family acetyltransferase involved in cellulose biosynthesis